MTAVGVVGAVLLGMTLPVLEQASCDAGKARSMAHLREISVAHASYAADWVDRQMTLVRDDLGVYGGSCEAYVAGAGCHPGAVLGADCRGDVHGFFMGCDKAGGSCANIAVVKPINWSGPFEYHGAFRLPNPRPFHEYLNGRFWDPLMWAPKDRTVLDLVEPLFAFDCEFVPADPTLIFSSSYVLSPAAMYHPDVFRPERDGGWQSPDGFDAGYGSPSVSQALYPAQKSRMLEHHWLQHPREECNPGFDPGSYDGCEPYYFNHSKRSNAVTLFYDGHIRGLSVLEAMGADARVEAQTGGEDRLWSRDTPWGENGYLIEYGYDNTETSYHILTTSGIRGRDTTF
jgi:hypothetical protein